MLKKLVVSLILATVLLTVAAPTFAATPAAAEPTTGELVTLAGTRVASAQGGLEAAQRADSLAQAVVQARKDAAAFQAVADADLATLQRAVATIPVLPAASATPLVTTSGLNLGDLTKILETVSTTPFVDPTARMYAVENAKSALSRARGSAAEAAKWDERASVLEKSAREAYQQAKDLLMPAVTAPVAVAPAATPTAAPPPVATVPAPVATVPAPVTPAPAVAPAVPAAPAAAAPPSLRPAERAEDSWDAGTWPQNLPKPAVAPSVTPTTVAPGATPAAATPAPATPVAAAPVSAPAATTPATAPVAPSAATPVTAPAEPMATKASVGALEKRIDEQEARLTTVEDAVKGINDLRSEIVALRSDIAALKDAQTAEIAGLRTQIDDLGKTNTEALRVQGETITTLQGDLNALRRQLMLTWVALGGLLALALILAIAIGVRRWWAARVARREAEEAAAMAAAAAARRIPPTGPVTGGTPRTVT